MAPHLTRGVLLAVSGGPDSRALLEAVARWPRRFDGAIHVASVDHGTRPSSRAEAYAVVARARVLGIDAAVLSLSRPGFGGDDGAVHADDEAALRAARYRALSAHAVQVGVGVVVVAHHEGDVAEGALMSWLGQGGDGAAMPAVRPLEGAVVDGAPIVVVRPFLALSRAALREALWAFDVVDVVVDPESRSLRARLRAGELAALGAGRSDVEPVLARAARRRRDDDEVLEAAALALIVGDDVDAAAGAPVRLVRVRAGPPGLLRRALKAALLRVAGRAPTISDVRASAPAIEVVVELMRRGTPGEVHLRGAVASVSRGSDHAGHATATPVMSVEIRALTPTVAGGTAPTHDGGGTRLSEAHLLVTLPARWSRPDSPED